MNRITGAKWPYIVVTLTGGGISWIWSERQLEQARIQFSVFDEFKGDAANAGKIWELLVDLFEYCSLPMLDGVHLVMRRDGLPREVIEDEIVQISGDFLVEQQT